MNNSVHVYLKDMLKHNPNREIEKSAVLGIVNLANVPGGTVADNVLTTLQTLSGDPTRETTALVRDALLNLSILTCSRANIVDAGGQSLSLC